MFVCTGSLWHRGLLADTMGSSGDVSKVEDRRDGAPEEAGLVVREGHDVESVTNKCVLVGIVDTVDKVVTVLEILVVIKGAAKHQSI